MVYPPQGTQQSKTEHLQRHKHLIVYDVGNIVNNKYITTHNNFQICLSFMCLKNINSIYLISKIKYGLKNPVLVTL